MGLLDIFGSGGIVGSVMDVLRGTGVIKDPEVLFLNLKIKLNFEQMILRKFKQMTELLHEQEKLL